MLSSVSLRKWGPSRSACSGATWPLRHPDDDRLYALTPGVTFHHTRSLNLRKWVSSRLACSGPTWRLRRPDDDRLYVLAPVLSNYSMYELAIVITGRYAQRFLRTTRPSLHEIRIWKVFTCASQISQAVRGRVAGKGRLSAFGLSWRLLGSSENGPLVGGINGTRHSALLLRPTLSRYRVLH